MESTNQMPQDHIEVILNAGYTIGHFNDKIHCFVKDGISEFNGERFEVKHYVQFNRNTSTYTIFGYEYGRYGHQEKLYSTPEIIINKVEDLEVLLRLLTQY
jgi:hypothetical protein